MKQPGIWCWRRWRGAIHRWPCHLFAIRANRPWALCGIWCRGELAREHDKGPFPPGLRCLLGLCRRHRQAADMGDGPPPNFLLARLARHARLCVIGVARAAVLSRPQVVSAMDPDWRAGACGELHHLQCWHCHGALERSHDHPAGADHHNCVAGLGDPEGAAARKMVGLVALLVDWHSCGGTGRGGRCLPSHAMPLAIR